MGILMIILIIMNAKVIIYQMIFFQECGPTCETCETEATKCLSCSLKQFRFISLNICQC